MRERLRNVVGITSLNILPHLVHLDPSSQNIFVLKFFNVKSILISEIIKEDWNR